MNWGSFFRPGMALMLRMRLPVKLACLSVILLLPLILVCLQLLARIQGDLGFIEEERLGLKALGPLLRLTAEVQKHRGQVNMLLSGNAEAGAALQQTEARLKQAVEDTRAALSTQAAGASGQAWERIESRLKQLPAQQQAERAASFSFHSQMVNDLERLGYGLGEQTGLLFDPDPASYLLIDMAVSRIMPWTEGLGLLRGTGSGLLSQATPPPLGLGRVHEQREALERQLQSIRFALQLLRGHGENELAQETPLASSQDFVQRVGQIFPGDGSVAEPRPSPSDYFQAGTKAIDDANLYGQSVLQRLEALLKARHQALQTERTLAVSATGIGLALLLYLLVSFYRSFVTHFRQVIEVMRGIANGNLRAQLEVEGRDELAELAALLQSMSGVLSGMVADVRSNSALVSHAGASLLDSSRQLSDRTEQQAANLEQTAASVEQLAGTVEHNAGIAENANTRAAQVRDQAEAGASAMLRAVSAVEGVQHSAGKMNEIIGVIDSLAFQTNSLALNAAVEAARAGEQGRGFAVVAAEVRSLAQRSAASSREIRQLISSSSEQVENSVALIREAGDRMNAITEGIRAVASSMAEISALSAEQSAGLGEITLAVQQLDQITQRNAQMVESSVSEASLLDHRASTLSTSVASFVLQQGTADEAVTLVQRALALGQRLPVEQFLRQVTDPGQGFHDRDMYVFVLDGQGAYRAFGGNPAKVGTRVQDIPGLDGAALLQRIIDQAAQGPGWVEYDIHNPATGRVQTKMSFVEALKGLYVGCGVYKSLQAG